MKKDEIKAKTMIAIIIVLFVALLALAEIGLCTLVNFKYPDWSLPAGIRGLTMVETYKLCFSDPVYVTACGVILGLLLIVGPNVIYPVLCDLAGREK